MTIPFTPYEAQANGKTQAGDVLQRLDAIEKQLAALTERVAGIEDTSAAPPRDDLNRKIMDFLRQYRGLKFTAFTVAENLGEPNPAVHTRLRTLARQELISTGQEDGRTRLYHLPADTDQ